MNILDLLNPAKAPLPSGDASASSPASSPASSFLSSSPSLSPSSSSPPSSPGSSSLGSGAAGASVASLPPQAPSSSGVFFTGKAADGKLLTAQKQERITQKIKRLVWGMEVPPRVEREALDRTSMAILHSMPPVKLRKKTINQTTAVVVYLALRELRAEVTVEDVVKALKAVERTPSLSRASKVNFSKNHSDVLGITKLASYLEIKASLHDGSAASSPRLLPTSAPSPALPLSRSPSPPPPSSLLPSTAVSSPSSSSNPRSSETVGALGELSRKLDLPREVEAKALSYCVLSEEAPVASRHPGSVAAACVLLAVKAQRHPLTLARLSAVSSISPCTIRKATRAMQPFLKNSS